MGNSRLKTRVKLPGASETTTLLVALQNENALTALGEISRRDESVVACTDYD